MKTNNHYYHPIKIKKFLLICLLCMPLSLWNTASNAMELKVGLGDLDYPPFYFEENGIMKGAAIEIAENVSRELGHNLSYNRYPWARTQRSLEVGEVDMMVLYFKTPEREVGAVYLDIPHINESSYLIVAKDSDIPKTIDLMKLQSYKFGNVRGYSHGKIYDNAEFLDKELASDEKILIRMLVRGRIDIAVGNKPVMLRYASQEGLQDDITFFSTPIDKGENYIAFTRARTDAQKLATEYSLALKKYMNTKDYQDILKKFGFDISVAM